MNIYEIRQDMRKNHTSLSEYKLRVVYYARVSTDKSDQLHSLEAQKSYFEGLLEKNPNWSFIKGYVDEGLTGTKIDKRDSFIEMIKDASLGKFDLICTKEVSRFARNTVDSLTYTRNLLGYGVAVYFENDNLNTIDEDCDFRLATMASLAQEESRKISERLRFGFKETIKKGTVLGNNNIWGYCKEKGSLIIVPKEAEMVRKIFDLYANENYGIRKIAELISDSGYRNSGGNPFSYSSIKGILTNPKYKGFYCGNKTHKESFLNSRVVTLPPEEWIMYEDSKKVPAIVSEKLWDKANRKLEERSKKMKEANGTSYQNKYAYSGKIICLEHNSCFHHVTYNYKSGKKEAWICKKRLGGNKCISPVLYDSELNAVMSVIISTLLCKNNFARQMLDIYKKSEEHAGSEKTRKKIQKSIDILMLKKERLLDLILDNSLTNDEFEERNSIITNQICALKQQLCTPDNPHQRLADKSAYDTLHQHIKTALTLPDTPPKRLIESLVDKIIVMLTSKENEIDLEIVLKTAIIPADTKGSVCVTRGGNSKSLKEYTLRLNYSLSTSVCSE